MSTSEDLAEAIDGFREAQNSLAELAKQALELKSALALLETTEQSLQQLTGSLDGLAERFLAVSEPLNAFSEQAGRAAGALLAADPDAVRREIVRGTETTELLRRRLDEIAADLAARIQQANSEMAANVDRRSTAIEEAIKVANQTAREQYARLVRLVTGALIASGIAIALQWVFRWI